MGEKTIVKQTATEIIYSDKSREPLNDYRKRKGLKPLLTVKEKQELYKRKKGGAAKTPAPEKVEPKKP